MRYIAIILLTAVSVLAENITVTIAYGDRADKVVKTTYKEGETALEVLGKAAQITTAKGKYKFVRSIDGKRSKPGSYGWFYLVNGEETHEMASTYRLKDAHSMTWYYKVEQCY